MVYTRIFVLTNKKSFKMLFEELDILSLNVSLSYLYFGGERMAGNMGEDGKVNRPEVLRLVLL